MRSNAVEALLGKPNRIEAEHGGQLWTYEYVETGTTIGITGTIHIVTGKLVRWEAPPWSLDR
jgi:hypothetical protein